MDFGNAFLAAQKSGEKELKPYWNGCLNLEDISDFVRNVSKQIYLELLKNYFIYTLMSFGIKLVFAWLPIFILRFSPILTYLAL